MNSRMKKQSFWLVTAIALGLPLFAAAQANPADPAAPGPALRYRSAFSDYKPWQELQPGDWRALNDSVRAPGGADDGGAATPEVKAAPAKPGSAPCAPAEQTQAGPSHGSHNMHGGQK